MFVLQMPREAGGWYFRATVVFLVLAPTIAMIQVGPTQQQLPTLTGVRTVIIGGGLLVATASLYIHHRITGLDQSGWLSVAVGLATVPTLTFGVYSLAHPQSVSESMGGQLVYRLAQTLLMLGVLLLARRARMPVDALALGLALGVALSVASRLIAHVSTAGPVSSDGLALAGVLLGLATLATGLTVLGIVSLPPWLRARSFLALGLLGVSTTLDPFATGQPVAAAVGLVTGLAGSLLVASSALAYANVALITRRSEVAELEERLARAESGSRADQVRLHEIDSTVAGIASASRLLHSTTDLSEGRRDVLAGMLAAEVARLERLTSGHGADRLQTFALDDVIGRMALMHRARGCRIEWTVSDLRVDGLEDRVAEILDVLLHNAARHGSPERIRVLTTRDDDGSVLVTVIDSGPGVPDDVRPHLFDDSRESTSRDQVQGVGLALARRQAREMGGDLWLAETEVGARFVLRMPLGDRSRV